MVLKVISGQWKLKMEGKTQGREEWHRTVKEDRVLHEQ
jgi:hypothetical protein